MVDMTYNPTFRHTDWVDRVDRVEAGGSNGFNGRFNAIGSDLRQLSALVPAIGAAIDQSNAPPPPPAQQELVFTPVLQSVSSTAAWGTSATGAAVVGGSNIVAIGLANLTLPDQVRLISMRGIGSLNDVIGNNVGGSIVLSRMPVRQSLSPPPPEQLASVIMDEGPFNVQTTVADALAHVDLNTFRYFVTATFSVEGLPGSMTIEAVHLTVAAT